MKVVEIFKSIQGEQAGLGEPSIFVRLAGCNLSCSMCDTKYSWDMEHSKIMDIDEIYASIVSFNCRNIVFTGGEPLLQQDDLQYLVAVLSLEGYYITIETNGTIVPNNLLITEVDRWNVSPKSDNISIVAIRTLNDTECNYILKFVVGNRDDVDFVVNFVKGLDIDKNLVYLMPKSANRVEYLLIAEKVANWCIGLGFSFSPREQLVIWDNKRGV